MNGQSKTNWQPNVRNNTTEFPDVIRFLRRAECMHCCCVTRLSQRPLLAAHAWFRCSLPHNVAQVGDHDRGPCWFEQSPKGCKFVERASNRNVGFSGSTLVPSNKLLAAHFFVFKYVGSDLDASFVSHSVLV
ncbi:hypothetical protein CC77DRAFT_570094 [Alternaria alternata]|uniref:Uncharacterized protein n=1 Tax=Alternaria alternata TaxID=5599 RepID=A0A177D4G6_ALTAL|nr:hypothetical protein CC77DRAFT_570094 [Alternaria alternata]OAG14301.1 hypothetical protein CC77DRAFT_570094 [Alternaria alternata]